MTDRFKNAIDRMKIYADGRMLADDWVDTHGDIYTLIQAATEAEQLRKERDELAAFIKKTNPDVVNVPDDIFLICVRAKKDN